MKNTFYRIMILANLPVFLFAMIFYIAFWCFIFCAVIALVGTFGAIWLFVEMLKIELPPKIDQLTDGVGVFIEWCLSFKDRSENIFSKTMGFWQEKIKVKT